MTTTHTAQAKAVSDVAIKHALRSLVLLQEEAQGKGSKAQHMHMHMHRSTADAAGWDGWWNIVKFVQDIKDTADEFIGCVGGGKDIGDCADDAKCDVCDTVYDAAIKGLDDVREQLKNAQGALEGATEALTREEEKLDKAISAATNTFTINGVKFEPMQMDLFACNKGFLEGTIDFTEKGGTKPHSLNINLPLRVMSPVEFVKFLLKAAAKLGLLPIPRSMIDSI